MHRGVYETAQVLYRRFLPLVQEHVAASPFAKVVFTGHSLGGSLGTLLMLMFLRRGVLPPVALSPAYTFGAPAVFCEGTEPGMCGLNGQVRPRLVMMMIDDFFSSHVAAGGQLSMCAGGAVTSCA